MKKALYGLFSIKSLKDRNLSLTILAVLFSLFAHSQTLTPIHNGQAIDYLAGVKYFGIPYGPTPVLGATRTLPGATFYNTSDSSMYMWTGTQWRKNSSGTIINPSPGVDSVVYTVSSICSWAANVQHCYDFTKFITHQTRNFDSTKTLSFNINNDPVDSVDRDYTRFGVRYPITLTDSSGVKIFGAAPGTIAGTTADYDSSSENYNNTKYIFYSANVPVDSVAIRASVNLGNTNLIQTGNRVYNGNGFNLKFNNLLTWKLAGANGSIFSNTDSTAQTHTAKLSLIAPIVSFPSTAVNNALTKILVLDGSNNLAYRNLSSITIPAQFNPIAGTNITLLGTYPNITFNASGGGASGISKVLPGYGQLRVNDSTMNTDTSLIETRARAVNEMALKLNLSDSASMLLAYKTSYPRTAISLTTTGSGAASYSSSTGVLNVPTPAGGGSQTLDQTLGFGNTSTKTIYTADSVKAYSFNSAGAMVGDSSALSIDSVIAAGASITGGTSGVGAGFQYTILLGNGLGAFIVNRAIASTSFQKISNGDSSFMDRLPGLPMYRITERFILIAGDNITNDHQLHIGYANLGTTLSKAIDTLHLNRGWPLNRIIVSTAPFTGQHTNLGSPVSNDSLVLYNAVVIATAKAKGVPYVDVFTYMQNNGGASLLNSDSVHPTNAGHYQIAQAFRFRISDIKSYGSQEINRNLLVKGAVNIGGILTMSTTSTATGNTRGLFSWGQDHVNGNALLLYDVASTSLRSGLGFSTSDASMSIFARAGGGGGDLLIGTGVDGSNITTSNAHVYFTSGTPSANGKTTTFNGTVKFSTISVATIPFTGTGNVTGFVDWGSVGTAHGIFALNNGTSALRSGYVYDGSNGPSYLFGRGGFEVFFSQGTDYLNTTTSNAAFYINATNHLVANGFATSYVAKTANYTLTEADHTVEATSGTFTFTLPTAVGKTGKVYYITNSGAGTITVGTTSSQTFVNVTATPTTLSLVGLGAVIVQSNGANWLQIK